MDFPAIPGLDTHRAALQLDHDWDFFLGLLRDFAAEYGDLAQRVRAELASGEPTKAARLLHTLRGTAGNIGALALMQEAASLEAAIKAQGADSPPPLEAFGSALAAVLAGIAPWVVQTHGSAAAPTGETPPAALDQAQLEALRQALAHHDLAALDLFEALQAALTQAVGQESVQALAGAITGLRFDAALAQLAPHMMTTQRRTP